MTREFKHALKLQRHQGVHRVDLPQSFLDVDSETEASSIPRVEIRAAHDLDDSDDDAQYILIYPDSPFYSPPTPPAAMPVFNPLPASHSFFSCQALETAVDPCRLAAELFHLEIFRTKLERIASVDYNGFDEGMLLQASSPIRRRPTTSPLLIRSFERPEADVPEDSNDVPSPLGTLAWRRPRIWI